MSCTNEKTHYTQIKRWKRYWGREKEKEEKKERIKKEKERKKTKKKENSSPKAVSGQRYPCPAWVVCDLSWGGA